MKEQSNVTQVDDKEATTDWISTNKIMETRNKSCSRKNFCAKMVSLVFSEEEMMTSNVSGKTPNGHAKIKKQLNRSKIEWIRKNGFAAWPLEIGEKTDGAWRDCIKAIDEACRRLNKPKKENLDLS